MTSHQNADAAALDKLVGRLSPPLLRYFASSRLKLSGLSIEEAARATSSTPGAVKQKVHRAYSALRRALGKD